MKGFQPVLLFILLTSCGTVVKNPAHLDSPEFAATMQRQQETYRILPGDELEIRFFHTPDLNVTLPVRPDGNISLPYAGEVRAARRTPEQLARYLVRRYARELRSPKIAVIVRSFSEQRIHVGGRVEEPGVFPLSGRMTVLQSLFEAGGTEPQALLSEVVIVRRTPDNSFVVVPVDIEAVLDGSDVSQNIALLPMDMVYVPDSPISDVNTWVDLYIRQNLPVNVSIRPEIGF